MALTALSGLLAWPSPPLGAAGTISTAPLTMDATGEKGAFICQVPKTGTISKVVFRTRTVATGGDCAVRLETVDVSTGHPSGTLVAARAEVDPFNIDDTDDNVLKTATLDTPYTGATNGDFIAVVIVGPTSGTPDIDIALWGDNPGMDGFPYSALYSASSWSKDGRAIICGFEYSDGSYAYIPGTFLFEGIAAVTYNSTDTPDEDGVKITMPVPATCAGYWIWVNHTADYTMKLYDSGDTLLASFAADKDISFETGGNVAFRRFASPVNLAKDGVYRLAALPGTSDISIYGGGALSAAQMDSHQAGQAVHRTYRTDAGSWTDVTSALVFMGLLLSHLDNGVGAGGGGSINRGILTGGRL